MYFTHFEMLALMLDAIVLVLVVMFYEGSPTVQQRRLLIGATIVGLLVDFYIYLNN